MAAYIHTLNSFFSQKSFMDMVRNGVADSYTAAISHLVDSPETKNITSVFSDVYSFMVKDYRNEYVYQNTLLNKLLLGKHNLHTTTALTQIPVGSSKADFILINGKAVVYEIKSDLDTFSRLDSQIEDYYTAFDHVCVLTSERYYETLRSRLSDTPVGISVLTKRNTISSTMKKEPVPDTSRLKHDQIFKVLRKAEFESVILSWYGRLPDTSQVMYYGACQKMFERIPLLKAYNLSLIELKKRSKVQQSQLDQIPYALKSLVYFTNPTRKEWTLIDRFLSLSWLDLHTRN